MKKNEILNLLYEVRVNEVAVTSPSEKKIMKKSIVARDNFQKLIEEKISDGSVKNQILECLDSLDENFGSELSELVEKYYKAGFTDAVNIIFDSFEYKKTGEK